MPGWTPSDIITQVQKRTEHRADNKIDMFAEFYWGLDEYCSEQHFWWRHKRFSFTSVVGSQIYDLSATTASGGIQPAGGVSDFAQFEEMILLQADGKTRQANLVPIIDPVAQLTSINNSVQDVPSGYFIDVNTSPTTFYFQAPASVAQLMLATYWAVPMINASQDASETVVPLVPPYLHWGLGYILERRVYEFLYGQDDPRFEMANGRYQEFVTKSARMPHWAGRKVQEAGVSAQVMPAVRATGNR